MAFPVSLPDDGLIDIMAMPLVCQVTYSDAPPLIPPKSSRKDVISAIAGADKGESFWAKNVSWFRSRRELRVDSFP